VLPRGDDPPNPPRFALDCIALARNLPAWGRSDYQAVRANLAVSVARLAAAGAQFFACPDNTSHIALEQPGPDLALPGLHIARVVAEQAVRDGRHRVGLLGTRHTLEAAVYPNALATAGTEAEIPAADDRATLHEIIVTELTNGIFTERSRREVIRITGVLKARGCDAVALVCTEIPLLVPADTAPLPMLDSTRLLARAAFEVATGQREPPTWRGGPPVSAGRDGG
jgi:aspartate racemase